jgi:hypothetical protein
MLTELIGEIEADANARHTESFFLESLGRMEAVSGNREAFDSVYRRVFELHPYAPLPRLHYSSLLFSEFKDTHSCERAIRSLEHLLNSGEWVENEHDLSRRAYDQKLNTLRAWLKGEKGGPLWP